MFATVRILLFGGMIGKVLAIARELIAAWLFGTGRIAASYRVSQTAFLIPFNGFLGDALSGGFIPVFARHKFSNDGAARRVFAAMHLILIGISIAVAAGLFWGAPQWIGLLAPGFDTDSALMATRMVQIMAFGVPFYIAASLYAAAELASGRGRLFAARASFQSVGLIAGAVAAYYSSQPLLIPAGFVLAYVVLSVLGVDSMRRAGMLFSLTGADWRAARADLREIGARFGVLMWMPVALQVHFIIERRVASVVHPAAVAGLDYARFVVETAVTLFAVPFGMAALGSAAPMGAAAFQAASVRSLRTLVYLGVPLSIILATHADLVVGLTLGHGAFGQESVVVTSSIMAGLALGLWAQLLGYVGVKLLNARGRNGAALTATAIGVVANVAINLALADRLGTEVLGIAFAVNSLLFAAVVIYQLRIIRLLAADILKMMMSALVYFVGWHEISVAGDSTVLAVIYATAFWGLVFTLIPSNRAALADMVAVMRRAG